MSHASKTKRVLGIAAVTVAFSLVGPGTTSALALDCSSPGPTADQYCPPTPQTGGGGLPFTGLDLGPAGLVALVLLGSGVALARLGRRAEPDG